MRAVVVTRLSKVTEATTSPERQRASAETLCAQREWTVVGYSDDLDVSGSTDPFRRRELGPWLERPDDFDVLVVYRLDRLTRSLKDLTALMEWADVNGVAIVSATEPFDTSTAIGAMIPKITAMVAELELDAISARNADAFDKNIVAGKYRGGVTPFGYSPARVDGEWRLSPHPEHAALIQRIAADLIGGGSVRSWVTKLNTDGVLTPKDQHATEHGRKVHGYRWSVGNLIRSLESPTLLGYAMRSHPELTKAGKVKKVRDKTGKPRTVYGPKEIIRDSAGEPVQRAEPILSLEEFQKLQAALASRRGSAPERREDSALLLSVLLCHVCGRKMYRLAKASGRAPSYRCSSAQYGDQCGNGTIQTRYADAIVEGMFLSQVGGIPFAEREFMPGDDHSQDIADIDAQLAAKLDLVGSPGFRSGPSKDALDGQLLALGTRREELAAIPYRESGYWFVPTGETFAEHWEAMTPDRRNAFLIQHEVTVRFRSRPKSLSHRPKVLEPVPGEAWHITFGQIIRLIEAVAPGLLADLPNAADTQATFETALQRIGLQTDGPGVERPQNPL